MRRMALDRATLVRILSAEERNAIVMLMRNGEGEDARRHAASHMNLGVDEFDALVRSARSKITQAQLRQAAEKAERRADPRPVAVAALDHAAQEEPESVPEERHNGRVPDDALPPTIKERAVPAALDYLREHGPTRAADLRRAIDVRQAAFSSVVLRALKRDHGVTEGARIDGSPRLYLPGQIDSDIGAGQQPETAVASTDKSQGDASPVADHVNGNGPAGTAAAVPPESGPGDDGELAPDAPAGPADEDEEDSEAKLIRSDREFREKLGPPAVPPFAGVEPEGGVRVLTFAEEDLRPVYTGMLFELARDHPDQPHLFDRIERLLPNGT